MTTAMNTSYSLLLVAVVGTAMVSTLTPSPATADTGPDPYPCPWRTLPHPEIPFIQNLGNWSVVQSGWMISYDRVVSARFQGVGKCNNLNRTYYELTLYAAERAGKPSDEDRFRAVVYVVNVTHPQKLMSFKYIYPASHPLAAN